MAGAAGCGADGRDALGEPKPLLRKLRPLPAGFCPADAEDVEEEPVEADARLMKLGLAAEPLKPPLNIELDAALCDAVASIPVAITVIVAVSCALSSCIEPKMILASSPASC